MNKKNLFRTLTVAVAASMAITACNDSQKMDEKPQPAAQASSASGLKVAYVEVDSLMTQYQYCVDYQKILEKRGNNIQAELASQEKNITAAAQNFQNKLKNNGFSSQQEAESQQAAIQRQQEQYVATRDKLGSELQKETEKFNKALHDSLQNFLCSIQ